MFRRLFDSYAEALRRYAQRFVRSREVAEDLVQEVFLGLWRSWDRIEVGPNTRSYLYIATRSRALNHLKRERTEARACRGGAGLGIIREDAALPPSSDATLEADDIVRAIERVLATMPPRQREVAALRLRHQLTTAEISNRLAISPRTVEVHIARATKALREQLPLLLPDQPAGSRAP